MTEVDAKWAKYLMGSPTPKQSASRPMVSQTNSVDPEFHAEYPAYMGEVLG